MKQTTENNILLHITGKQNAGGLSVDALQQVVNKYPAFGLARFLLAKRMKEENHPGFEKQAQAAILHFPNSLWFHFKLNEADLMAEKPLVPATEETAEEPIVENKVPEETPATGPKEVVAVEEPVVPLIEEPVEEAITENKVSEEARTTEPEELVAAEEPVVPTLEQPTEETITKNKVSEEAQTTEPEEAVTAEELPAPAPEPVEEAITENKVLEVPQESEHEAEIAKEELLLPPAQEAIEEPIAENKVSEEPAPPDTIKADIVEEPSQHNSIESVVEINGQTLVSEPGLEESEPQPTETLSPEIIADETGESVQVVETESITVEEGHGKANEELQGEDEGSYEDADAEQESQIVALPNDKIAALLKEQLEEFKKPVEQTLAVPIETEPYHTVDYFASQGIKLNAEQQKQDHLSVKVRKFTDWLKQMKRVSPQPADLGVDEVSEHKVQDSAASSNQTTEIVTETMAEVLALQGMTDKAIQVYIKLSFLDPSKSAYFAAKIEQLKGI